MLAAVGDHLSAPAAHDVALVVSELVTNSVMHAATGPAQHVGIEVGVLDDRVLIAVSDRAHGSCRGSPDASRRPPTGWDSWSSTGWPGRGQVARDGAGGTRVWCEIALHARG